MVGKISRPMVLVLALASGVASAPRVTVASAPRVTAAPAPRVTAPPAEKDHPPAKKGPKKVDPDFFWFHAEWGRPAAAGQLVLAQDPFMVIAQYLKGKVGVWGELEFSGDAPIPLDPQWLRSANQRDGRPLPDIRGRAPDTISRAEYDFINLYSQALVASRITPPEVFVKAAKENRDVGFAQLYNEPWKYRGKIIHIEGRLRRLRKFDAPLAARPSVSELYEGWIFAPPRGSHPYCVIFTSLPEKIKPEEDIDRHVEFNGYFLCRYRYLSGKGHRDTLLLIGPAVILTKGPAPAREDTPPLLSSGVLYLFFGFVAVVAVVMVVLAWVFRRGDKNVRKRLERLQEARVFDLENSSPEENGNKPDGNGFIIER